MRPDLRADAADRTDGEGASADRHWHALQASTDQKRANIIADVVGHPTMISVAELKYMNPDLSEDSIRRHLSKLEDVDVVEVHELEQGDRMRDFPYKFYSLTDMARSLFDQLDMFPVDAWNRQYQSVEKTPEIRRIEAMPRPDSSRR